MCLQLVRITYHHFFFFFNDTATTEIYTLSLHDALPISPRDELGARRRTGCGSSSRSQADHPPVPDTKARYPSRRRSEEHTSELQSQSNLVCRLLLEKKNTTLSKTNAHHRNRRSSLEN